MSRIHRTGNDGFQPDTRSSWQRDRASAPMERNPEDSPLGWLIVFAIGVAIALIIGATFYQERHVSTGQSARLTTGEVTRG